MVMQHGCADIAAVSAQVEQLRAELAGRGGSSALVSTPSAPSPVGADTGSPQAGGLNGSAEVRHHGDFAPS